MPVAYGVLLADLLALGCCLIFGSRLAAWILLVTSAAWLPANNKALEGAVIIGAHDHGLTVSDLLSVAGLLLAAAVLVRHARAHGSTAEQHARAARVLAACLAVFAGGVIAAWLTA